jgi:hypothetical protein
MTMSWKEKAMFVFIVFLLLVSILLLIYYIQNVQQNRKKHKKQRNKCSKEEEECVETACEFRTYQRSSNGRPAWNSDNSSVDMTTKSTNWAGFVAATSLQTPRTNSCTKVTGTFVIPTLQRDVTDPDNNVSIWVGLDGAFSSDPTVEQIGIDLANVDGQTQAYAWFEMYPKGAYEIVGFPVNAGETIMVTVAFLGSGIYQLSMSNLTQRVKVTIPTFYTRSSFAKRQCVEWIVEAPYFQGVLPLTHFNPITFTNCSATINGVTNTISHFAHDNFIMTTEQNVPKATPSALSTNGSSFSVTWQHE